MTIKSAAISSAKSLWKSLPLILGTVMLVGLVSVLIPKSFYQRVFGKGIILDSLIGSSIGSLAAGNPITSYVLAGELLNRGISLVAITAFLTAWVTVGIVQFPAESAMLGKRFAFLRNFTSFIFSIIVAATTVAILRII
jgi:uncharacterized membrane protein YraQ (UPF0718 family)